MYVLGIDGGGTRTTGIIADEFGTVYTHAVMGRSNPNTLQQEEFEEVMCGLVRELKRQNDAIFNQLSVCFAGIAGVGESGRDAEVAALLARELPEETKVIVRNDAFNALYSGTLGGPGIVQIAGTGAVTLGINENGEIARSGGWGYLFDDEGSGFYLGNEALRAVFRSLDNRGPATSLTDRVKDYFEVQHVPDIIGKVYGKEHPRSVVAPLSQLVVHEAQAGDAVSQHIIEKACVEMMHSIKACHRRLFEEDHPTTIVLSGGVFTDAELFLGRFRELASQFVPNVVFQPTQVSPVGGAVLAGLADQQILAEAEFANRLNEQLQRAGVTMTVVSLSEIDVADIVKLWNEEIGERFPMSTALWRQNTTTEPNVLQEGSLAIVEEGQLHGFIVAKRYAEKLDTSMPTNVGWIQCMIVSTSARNRGVGTKLLNLAEQALIDVGVNEIRLGRDPWHYFPGVPLEDEATINWFEKHGYTKGGVETDLIKEVRDGELYKLTNPSEHYRLLTKDDIPSLLSFLERVFPGRWHYEAIHYDLIGGTGREFMGFFIEDELHGFCRLNDPRSPVIAQNVYWSALIEREMGGMGPLGIDRDIRGKHFGIDLVKAAANELIKRGITDIVIDWTQLVPFYGKLGFTPWKHYQSMAKPIGVVE